MSVKMSNYLPRRCWLILPTLVCAIALSQAAQAQDKFLELTPPNTDVIEHTNEGSPRSVTLSVYKFKSQSSKETIARFYRRLFYNEGYQEYEDNSAADDSRNQAPYYLFSKPGKLGVLNIQPADSQEDSGENLEENAEEPTLVYYITIHHLPSTDVKPAVKQ
jgi:hypothetical protein